MGFPFNGLVRFEARHPRSNRLLASVTTPWEPKRAIKGFYSRVEVSYIKEAGRLGARAIDDPIGLKNPVVRIRFIPTK